MSRLQSRESHALRQLHDISDYSQYIDERIAALNNIYHSLTIKKQTKSKSTFQRQTLQVDKTNYTNKRYQIPSQPIRNQQKRFRLQKIYITEYINRQKPGFYKTQDMQYSNQMKSLTQSFFTKTIDNSYKGSQSKDESYLNTKRKNKHKLQMYESIKNEILDTFYVDGKSCSKKKERVNAYMDKTFQQPLPVLTSIETKSRKGKLWTGRPPVKIIQKFQ